MPKFLIMKMISIVLFFSLLPSINQPNEEMKAKPALDIKAQLGEGALWDYKNNRLLWIDIEQGILHVFDPKTGKNESFEQGMRIGTVVPIDTGGFVVALEDGVYTFDPVAGKKIKRAAPPELNPGIRFNDGKCDPSGRFWAGTMSLKNEPNAGALYRFDGDFSFKKMIDRVSISNGIVWSKDKKRMYYIDTPTRKVTAYDYDDATGHISNGKTTIEIPAGMGSPDGSVLDAEGMLWIGMWGGGCVTRWNPETGELLQKIDIPALNVTSCAFGGEGLETLYVTTASIGMPEEKKKTYPDAGKLFALKPGVKGIPASYFKVR